LTLTNRAIGNIKTAPGNIAQCLPVTSDQSIVPGQFALSAVDGAASTKWQPLNANITSSMTVSLSRPFVLIDQILFDWAQAPPTSYRVTFHNLSDTTLVPPLLVAASDNIAISNPYDAAMASEVVPYRSNTTNVTLAEPVWSALYATLEVFGTQAGRNVTTGATVAEWSLIAAS
jgi:hypothetical protein